MEKSISSRRSFIAKTSLALAGTTLLTSTSSFGAIFGESIPFKGYSQISEFKNDLRTPFSDKTIKVSGTLYTTKGELQPCKNAIVEIWHLSPNSKKYNHQGKFITDENGNYTFWTDFPNREKGYCSRIFFKATTGKKTEFTELILNDYHAYISHTHWEKNKELGEILFPTHSPSTIEGEIEFNFTIN